jgi:hypothetical protein
VSDVREQEVGEKFGMRQKTVLPLHRQKFKAAIKRLKRMTKI